MGILDKECFVIRDGSKGQSKLQRSALVQFTAVGHINRIKCALLAVHLKRAAAHIDTNLLLCAT